MPSRATRLQQAYSPRIFTSAGGCRSRRTCRSRTTAIRISHESYPKTSSTGSTAGEQAQEFIKQNGAYCKGLPAGEIERKLKASALLTAAKLGDEEAAACFVSDTFYYARPMPYDDTTYPAERDDPELAAMYSTEAVQVAEAGIRRGDWRMVAMLGLIYSDGSSANPFGNKLARPNGEKHYLYGVLRLLGVTDPDWLQRIRETPMRVCGGVTTITSSKRAGELRDEAQQLFDTYFRDSGPVPEDMALCDM